MADRDKPKRKRLLAEAAKISSYANAPDALRSFLELITSVQAVEAFKSSPPSSFAGELMVHLIRLVPGAVVSPDSASTFIECLDPLENIEDFVLPASLYRAIASAEEPPTPPLRGHTWKRRKEHALPKAGSIATPSSSQVITGLQTLREYLCMNGQDAVECGSRTVVATLIRALLGSWDGSVFMGRELFDQSVLKNPDRSLPVGLGLEVLLQSLLQDDGIFWAEDGKVTNDDEKGNPSDNEDDRDKGNEDNDTGTTSRLSGHDGQPRRHRNRRIAAKGPAALPVPDETRACVTIVGNYVRADPDTSSSFFQDVIPKVLLMGVGGGGKGRGGSTRVPGRLAAVFRALVNSTRSRNSFNMERMIMHTVKEVKNWDSAVPLSASFSLDIDSTFDEEISEMEETGNKGIGSSRGGGGNVKQRRRGLILACLDILGPTPPCISMIRDEMVDGESKASLRSTVADALLEYRRTCDTSDADDLQEVFLDILVPLAGDSFLGVRLSALAAVGEACSSDCLPALSLLLQRCLDSSPKVRRLAVRLLVDEYGVGIGSRGVSLARAVLYFSQGRACTISAPSVGSTVAQGRWNNNSSRAPTSGGGGGRVPQGKVRSLPLLGRLLRHQEVLEETDKERFPVLLSGMVEAVLRGEGSQDFSSAVFGAGRPLSDPPGVIESSNSNDDCGESRSACDSGVGSQQNSSVSNESSLGEWLDAMGGSWEDLAAPAGCLREACQPFDPALIRVLDRIIGDALRCRE